MRGRELHLLPGTAPAFMTKAGHLSVLHYADCWKLPSNPARASASWNHRMQTGVLHSLSGASAASTSQSRHVLDGHDAQAACEQK